MRSLARRIGIGSLLLLACAESSSRSPAIVRVGDVAEPLAAFERFLELHHAGKLDSDEARDVVRPELAKEFRDTPTELRLTCNQVIRLDDTHAVARTSFTTPEQAVAEGELGGGMPATRIPAREVDVYWYLERTDRWLVAEDRALACTDFLVIEAWGFPEGTPGLGADVQRNARLVLKSDRELARWFTEHEAALDAIARDARALAKAGEGRRFQVPFSFSKDAKPDAMTKPLSALDASSVLVREDGSVDVVLGGATDNEVLFRHVPDGTTPRITPDDLIWVEPVGRDGSGWFLVRTT